ncbi:MAG: DUF116 domain-containing protein [Ruminiclostridium sp.]
MKVITYSLKNSSDSSDNYYNCIGVFSKKVIERAHTAIGTLIGDFEAYIKETGSLSVSSGYELIVEALTLGVFWKVYGNMVICLKPMFRGALTFISKRHGKNKFLSHGIDIIKGVLITLTLAYPSLQHKSKSSIPTVEQLTELLLWLEAFGDFEQEVKRLKYWVDFMYSENASNKSKHLKDLMEFTVWFGVEGQNYLGKYTRNVDSFIKQKQSFYRWREDRIFCFRKPIEYHLNMVGAELLSREYRTEFLKSIKKQVLLPVCMRSRPEGKCMATSRPLGLVCEKCTPGCIVNKITSVGDKNGYEVYIISHESSAFSDKDMGGIVGVSCVTRLIEGGWKAKELGISPQCVLLDYCGCKKHWDERGIPTTLNISELNKIMQESIDPHRKA